MKKQIALILAMLFLGAGAAGAADFSLSGSYFAAGHYANFGLWQAYSETDGVPDSAYEQARGYGVYEHELSVDATIAMSEATKVFARFEMRDENWTGRNSASNFNEGDSGYGTQPDDNFVVEQVYGSHTFGNGGEVRVGLMPSGYWGTSFGDTTSEAYRVYYQMPTSVGTFLAILQKNAETASTALGEDNDSDSYYLAGITKVGNVFVKPAFVYTVSSNENAAKEANQTDLILALDGGFGNVGFEGEVAWQNVDMNQEVPAYNSVDYSLYGLYGKAWLTQNALTVGLVGAFGSYDDESNKGFDFGDDFSAGGALLMGNHITFLNSGNDLSAGRLVAGYFDYAASEKLSFGGYLGYATCSADDDNSIWDGASVSEISGDVTYQITPNLTYSVAAGVAKFGWGDETVDPKNTVLVSNSLGFSF